jgi:hypothetical protein
MATYGKKASDKVEKTMHERKHGTLKSGGSGKKVTSKKQAIAIGLSEARKGRRQGARQEVDSEEDSREEGEPKDRGEEDRAQVDGEAFLLARRAASATAARTLTTG